ncbi:hypothetical protein DF182_19120 [Chitinophaga flava]|uniref:Uncharacterized protein n=1 Tax=Chitinophaga flava TaxID=2259036 RepID=A0A365XRM4_9BACT|nr:hypothetical protein DF182_19120 [Chitinophaga flava]
MSEDRGLAEIGAGFLAGESYYGPAFCGSVFWSMKAARIHQAVLQPILTQQSIIAQGFSPGKSDALAPG